MTGVEFRQKKQFNNAIDILTSQGKFHIKLGLERISEILDLLGNPQDRLKIVHVAGTNGKGSVCAMLSSILTKAGYKTGMYTSPHLIEYTERLKINNIDISKDDFAKIFFEVHNTAEKNKIHLSEFEILTAMAFLYFDGKTDIVILETGLGGRLDATNAVKNPVASIITSIDIDHKDRLGDTIEKIAFEKAGIIKVNSPVIVSITNNGLNIIKKKAVFTNSKLFLADLDTKVKIGEEFGKSIVEIGAKEYELSLMGVWQGDNLALVLKAIELLNKNGFEIAENIVIEGLKQTKWSARMQYIKSKNLIIDGAHNFAAAKLLKESLELYFPKKQQVWLYSSLNTKDYEAVTDVLFKENDIVILTEISSGSAVKAEVIRNRILEKNKKINVCMNKNLKESFQQLCSYNSASRVLISTGSLYLAGDLLKLLSPDD
jgi:dihydrofolate synthase/folylpolyglutamate synthase